MERQRARLSKVHLAIPELRERKELSVHWAPEVCLEEMEIKDSMDLPDQKEIQGHLENEENEVKMAHVVQSAKREKRAALASQEFPEPKDSRAPPVTPGTWGYLVCKETLDQLDLLVMEKAHRDLPVFKDLAAAKDPLGFQERTARRVPLVQEDLLAPLAPLDSTEFLEEWDTVNPAKGVRMDFPVFPDKLECPDYPGAKASPVRQGFLVKMSTDPLGATVNLAEMGSPASLESKVSMEYLAKRENLE